MNPDVRRTALITITIIFTILLLMGLGWMTYQFRAVIAYIAIAAVLSLMGRPILKQLSRLNIKGRYLPDSLKAILTLVTLLGLFSLLFSMTLPPLLSQINGIQSRLSADAISEGLQEPLAGLESFLRKYDLIELAEKEELVPEGMDELPNEEKRNAIVEYVLENIGSVLDTAKISNVVNGIIGFTGDFLIGMFSVVFILFFFLKERSLLYGGVRILTPVDYRDELDKILASSKNLLTRYFIGVVIEVLLVGLLISLGLSMLGVKNAFTIGFFAGLFNVIPYLGPIIGAVLGLSLTVIGGLEMDFYSQMVPLLLKVAVVFLVVQLIDNF
ncbi:MAG: AI-2E family transporter, partial [Bacteroidota bacterium]